MVQPQSTIETVSASVILKTTTSATGTAWVPVGNANALAGAVSCFQISIFNSTAAELQFGTSTGSVPVGETFELPSGASFAFRGLRSSGQLLVRRTDVSSTPVTFKAVAERK